MARAIDVARYFIQLASAEDEPDYLSHLRLQKLLYYAQGWSLGQRAVPMFPERIEAWSHGPVVRDLYSTFSPYGYRPIPPEDFAGDADLHEDDREFVESVWNAYKGHSALSLREMTHQEKPWLDARNGLGPADRCENEITTEALTTYFTDPD